MEPHSALWSLEELSNRLKVPNAETIAPGAWEITRGCYRARLAASSEDRRAAYRLRFLVFNLELQEGLEGAYETGCDTDEFDPWCDHLIVEHRPTGQVVGTYRLQTGTMAARHLGYYSEREFVFTPYRAMQEQMVELGRACVHREHRAGGVLELLWKGIARYVLAQGCRFLIGCSSLTSQDPAHGARVYEILKEYEAAPALRTIPQPEFALPPASTAEASGHIPKLLRTYLAVGARICGPPALDRAFRTIDFLTWMDLDALHPRIRARLLTSA